MGVTYSIEGIQQEIKKLNKEVQSLNNTTSRKRCKNLEKRLMEVQEMILRKKTSIAYLSQKIMCDQLMEELNKCLQVFTVKVASRRVGHEGFESDETLIVIMAIVIYFVITDLLLSN